MASLLTAHQYDSLLTNTTRQFRCQSQSIHQDFWPDVSLLQHNSWHFWLGLHLFSAFPANPVSGEQHLTASCSCSLAGVQEVRRQSQAYAQIRKTYLLLKGLFALICHLPALSSSFRLQPQVLQVTHTWTQLHKEPYRCRPIPTGSRGASAYMSFQRGFHLLHGFLRKSCSGFGACCSSSSGQLSLLKAGSAVHDAR